MRFACALAGDSNEDANFEHAVANAAILKLTNELQFIEKAVATAGEMRTGHLELFVDEMFQNEIHRYVAAAEASVMPLPFTLSLLAILSVSALPSLLVSLSQTLSIFLSSTILVCMQAHRSVDVCEIFFSVVLDICTDDASLCKISLHFVECLFRTVDSIL